MIPVMVRVRCRLKERLSQKAPIQTFTKFKTDKGRQTGRECRENTHTYARSHITGPGPINKARWADII